MSAPEPSEIFTALTRRGFVRLLTWEEARPGNRISFVYYGHWGFERAYRTVVAVDWPMVTLAEGDRHYSIDAEQERNSKNAARDLRLEHVTLV